MFKSPSLLDSGRHHYIKSWERIQLDTLCECAFMNSCSGEGDPTCVSA